MLQHARSPVRSAAGIFAGRHEVGSLGANESRNSLGARSELVRNSFRNRTSAAAAASAPSSAAWPPPPAGALGADADAGRAPTRDWGADIGLANVGVTERR